jgi:two-component system NtrC family sensor kinase
MAIEVADTGKGFDEATRARVFEPFYTTKEIGEGTGLGLSVSWGLVREHGGWIEVVSEPEKGSTFTVYLPTGAA